MTALYTCPPSACADNGVSHAFIGGTEASWQQITSQDHPCLVGFNCELGGVPATVWIWKIDPEHPEHPVHPPHPPHPPKPVETPEPWTLALIGAGLLGLIGLRRRA